MSLETLTKEGAQVITRCDVYLEGLKVDEVPIVDGRVSFDSKASVRRSCDVTLYGDIPLVPSDPLAPAGSNLHIYRGARDWTGEDFFEAQGVYAFEASSVRRSDRLVRVTGYDFSKLAQDARWESLYSIAKGTNSGTAISTALETRLSPSNWKDPNFLATTRTTPDITWGEERDNDPWADLSALAASIGMDLFFDKTGTATLDNVPDPATGTVAWNFTVGTEPTLLTTSKELYGRPYNVVVARGEPPDDSVPVEATAEDNDQNSSSYVGLYRRPYFMTSPFITTVEQAQDAADAQLLRLIGMGEVVGISCVPIPTLDAGSIISATDPDIGVDARYVIDRYELPLRVGSPAIIVTRRRLL